MSIIAEALKKAEQNKTEKKPNDKRRPPALRPEEKRFSPRLYLRVGLLFIFILLLGALLWLFPRTTGWLEEKKSAAADKKTPHYVLPVTEEKEERFEVLQKPLTLNQVAQELRLTGIMYAPEKPLAVINDTIWSEGETVADYRILKITKASVIVKKGTEEFELRLVR